MVSKNNTSENLWKVTGIVVLGLIALALVSNVFSSARPAGYTVYYNSGSGLSLNGLISNSLVLILNVLKILLIVGLVGGSVLAAKKYLQNGKQIDFSLNFTEGSEDFLCPSCGAFLEDDDDACPNCKKTFKRKCACGKVLDVEWSCCPYCGAAQEKETLDDNSIIKVEGK